MIRYINKRFANQAEFEDYVKKAVLSRTNGKRCNDLWKTEVIAKYKPLMNEAVLNDIIDTIVSDTNFWESAFACA